MNTPSAQTPVPRIVVKGRHFWGPDACEFIGEAIAYAHAWRLAKRAKCPAGYRQRLRAHMREAAVLAKTKARLFAHAQARRANAA